MKEIAEISCASIISNRKFLLFPLFLWDLMRLVDYAGASAEGS